MEFIYKRYAAIDETVLLEQSTLTNEYTEYLRHVAEKNSYEYPESSINLPFDEDIFNLMIPLKEKMLSKPVKRIVLVGIGGDNLGTKAVYEALKTEKTTEILFLDTLDEPQLEKILKILEDDGSDDTLIIIASKSGKTIETLYNSSMLLQVNKAYIHRTIFITSENSPLWNFAQKNNCPALPIPLTVGGRYSVFSAVGLFPLFCAGIDTVKLLEGAMEARNNCLDKNILNNPARISAQLIFGNLEKDKNILDMLVFAPKLEALAKWYRQLVAESLGKDGKNITPTISVGTTDLHSVWQSYIGGHRNKQLCLVTLKHANKTYKIKGAVELPSEVKLKNINLIQLRNSIQAGVKETLLENRIPFTEIALGLIEEKEIGNFMQFKMMEVMQLGKLLKINAFDQPDVEGYKRKSLENLKIYADH